MRRLGESDHCLGRESHLVPQAQPLVIDMWRAEIGQVGLGTVADIEEVPQSFGGSALLAFAQQRGNRHAEEVAQEIKQRRLDRRHCVNSRAQVEGLHAAATEIAIGEALVHLVENIVVHPDRATDDQRPRILERLTDARATGNFAHAGVAGIVLEDHDVAGEERPVRTAKIQEHAVMAGHRDDRHLCHHRRSLEDVLRHELFPATPSKRPDRPHELRLETESCPLSHAIARGSRNARVVTGLSRAATSFVSSQSGSRAAVAGTEP